MFGIIKLTIHTITGMWVSIVLFKLMTNGWSGFYFQCCVLSLVFLTVSWLLSGEWLAGKISRPPLHLKSPLTGCRCSVPIAVNHRSIR